MAKATVKTKDNEAVILAAVGKGASLSMAAECAGIDPSTLYAWKRESHEFRASIARARAVRAQVCLSKIVESEDWRAHAWYLERQYPEDFALIQRIEQVLRHHGLIGSGNMPELEDGEDLSERIAGMSTDALIQKLTNEQLIGLLKLVDQDKIDAYRAENRPKEPE